MLNVKYPSMQDFMQNSVGIAGKVELIWQPLFDWNIYPTAGIAQLTFFQTPQGQGNSAQPIAAAAAKTAADTNMTQAGQLPAPQAFWADGIEVVINPGSVATANLFANVTAEAFGAGNSAAIVAAANDYYAIAQSGLLTLNIMSKAYYQESPLSRFPQRSAVRGDFALATNSATTGTNALAVMRCDGQPVRFDPGYGIATSSNFNVVLSWPAVVATAANNARIGVMINGWLFRAAQ